MGMYTDFYYTFFLKDAPDEVLEILDCVNVSNVDPPKKLPKHEFFKCPRWESTFGDYETNRNWQEWPGGYLDVSDITVIGGHSNFKDYDQEIEKFIDWLEPYIVGGAAWSHYEGNVYSGQVDFDYGYDHENEKMTQIKVKR